MNEIEVKARVQDIGKVREKLTEMGCLFSRKVRQKDEVYLHHSIGKFPKSKKGVVTMRIRDSNGVFFLTMKKTQINELDCIENEVEVKDPVEARKMLENLGFKEFVRVEKTREKCRLEDMTICLDEVEGLGNFIEIEKLIDPLLIRTSEANAATDGIKVQEELFSFLEGIGVRREDRVFKGYDSLTMEKKTKSQKD